MKKTFLCVLFAMVVVPTVWAQDDLQTTLTRLAGKAALGYVDPVSQGFLTNFNGGLFHKAPQAKLWGIDLEIGVVAMSTPFGDLPKTFDANDKFRFNKLQADDIAAQAVTASGNPTRLALEQSVRNNLSTALQSSDFDIRIYGPTVIGSAYSATDPTSEVKIDMNSAVKFQYVVPVVNQVRDTTLNINKTLGTKLGGANGLSGISSIPFLAPQITLGTLFGTQFTLRYVPKIKLQDVGDLSWTGFGIQHNLGYWFPIPIVDVAASFYTQTIKIDPLFEMSGTAFGLNVSKQFGFKFFNVTPYAGFMLENAKFKVHIVPPAADYGPGITPPDIAFEIEGKNTSRLTLGLSLRLLIFNINADYNIGTYNSMTAGLFFAI